MPLKHTLLALVVVLIWGSNFVVIEAGLEDVPPLLFVAIRFVLVSIPAVFFVKRPGIGWRSVLAIGTFLSVGQFAFLYVGLQLGTPPGVASLLVQIQAILTIGLAAVFLRERPSRRQLVGVVIATGGLGTVVASQLGATELAPLLFTLSAALSWAIGNFLTRQAQAASGLSLVVWSGLVVPIPLFLLSLLVDGPPSVFHAITHFPLIALASTAFTAYLASLVGYTIWNGLLAKHPAASVVPFALLIPVVGVIVAWLVRGEIPTIMQLAGGAVMLTGIALATLSTERVRDRALAQVAEAPEPAEAAEAQSQPSS